MNQKDKKVFMKYNEVLPSQDSSIGNTLCEHVLHMLLLFWV